MTAKDLLDAYPGVSVAVAYVELILCQPEGPESESFWDIILGAKLPPEGVLNLVRAAMKEAAFPKAQQVLAETYHPSFMTYLAAKLGMM